MPPKNPPIPPALRKQCKAYLEETHPSKWDFTAVWNGDPNLLSGCGDVWLKALQDILNNYPDDHSKCLAAVMAKNKFKERKHLSESSSGRKGKSKGSSKSRKKSQKAGKVDAPDAPPSYNLCSQEGATCEVKSLDLHEKQHQALSADQKWYLPSGRSVEDALFAWVKSQSDEARRSKQTPKESYAHSYILDVDDQAIEVLFEKEEWNVITSLVPPFPPVDASLVSYMHKFADVKTASDLRLRLATTSYISSGETYCREKHGNQAWVYSVLTSLVVLYELDHMQRTDNLEAWFQINIWGPIFDRCFQHTPKMSIIRSESQSPHNSERKNLTTSTRKLIGNKYDGLIVHNRIEFGAVEDSKQFQGEKSRKWTSDSLKLAKLLHDQLRGLEIAVRNDRDALRRFRCVGFLTAGLHCRGLFLGYGRGHVCLLKRGTTCVVPENVEPLSGLVGVLVAVWQMREVVKASVENLVAFYGNTEVLFRAAVEQGAGVPAILRTCFDTDTEL